MTNIPPKKTSGWSTVKQHIKNWDTDQLTALIKDFYDSSANNRTFLEARLQANFLGGSAMDTYRERIVEQFYPKRGNAKLKLGEARKAIREYKKATGSVEGTIELLLTYLESGNEFTCDFGDINGPFYDSLCSVMDELATLLKAEGKTAYANVADRLNELATTANGIGWGYGDHITGTVSTLKEQFGEP